MRMVVLQVAKLGEGILYVRRVLHLEEAVRHLALVKPNNVHRTGTIDHLFPTEMRNLSGAAKVFERRFEKLAVLVLRGDIGRKVFHVANLYQQPLIITVRENLLPLRVLVFQFKFGKHFRAGFFECPQARLYFEYLFGLLHDAAYRFVGRFCSPCACID